MPQRTFMAGPRPIFAVGVALTLAWLAVYLMTVSPTVNFIDSGELITAAYEPGIAHPPGYPLYTLMGYVVSHLLWGEVAWRVNALSAFWGAMAVGALFFLLVRMAGYLQGLQLPRPSKAQAAPRRRKGAKAGSPPQEPVPPTVSSAIISPWLLLGAAAGASLFGASSTFWSRTAQAKMYTLHYFFVLALLLAALSYRAAYERGDTVAARRWLVALAAGLGLSFANHLMTMLVVPGILALVALGGGWRDRVRALVRPWPVVLPALLLPLLFYLYLPLRSSQGPFMNWGSPDSLGDFWRHISGWQYRTYLNSSAEEVGTNLRRIFGFMGEQWNFLSWPLIILSLVGALGLARTHWPLFLATSITAVLTFLFSLAYSISEIEPYMAPFYAMLVVWLGSAPATLPYLLQSRTRTEEGESRITPSLVRPGVAALGAIALIAAVLQYPRQDLSRNRLAEQFAMNVFNSLPPNSILITDYWDFYAPTYYLQTVKGVRPDVTVVDQSLLRYPWYTGQLRTRYPGLMEKSNDILGTFSTEQRKWVNGESYNQSVLQNSYFELLNSFIERNYNERPAYVLFLPCSGGCESDLVAPSPQYLRVREGLAFRVWKGGPPEGYVPPEPQWELQGITGERVPFDEFAHANTRLYGVAYGHLAQIYERLGLADKRERMLAKASEIEAALEGR